MTGKHKREGTSRVAAFGLGGSKQTCYLHFMSYSRISPLILLFQLLEEDFERNLVNPFGLRCYSDFLFLPAANPIMARRTPGREASGASKIFSKISILLLEYLFGLCCALFPTIEKYLVMFAWGWVRWLTTTKSMAVEVEILGDSWS